MLTRITKKELHIFETLCSPMACAEIMFDDFSSLTEFTENKYSKVRTYQYPMMSYTSQFYENPKLSPKENFRIKRGLGSCLNFGGRLTGKSFIGIIVDIFINTWHKTYNWGAVSSCDATKIRGIMESIILPFENHPILKQLNIKHKSHPAYLISFANGVKLESINNNAVGKEPGKNWFQKHIQFSWEEEASFLNDTITNKRLMAQSEFGMVERLTGMANFKKLSPIGRKFFDIKNENIKINLPSYVNETWDKEKDDAAVQEFMGKQSPGYKTQILGQVVDDGQSVYDIERIRECYKRDRDGNPIPIKSFEINKLNFCRYKEKIILDRPKNAESVWVCLDKGEGAAPSEIIILFKIKGIYKYEYNVTTFKLSPDEDEEVVDYVITQVKANIVGIDSTSGGGKGMLSHLAKKYPKNMVGVSFNEKIPIDFELDEHENRITDNKGNYVYKYEYVRDWSIQRLIHLFSSKQILALYDSKLDTQFDSIISLRSGNRRIYKGKSADHLHQAFQVFAIALWNHEFSQLQPIKKKKPGMGAF